MAVKKASTGEASVLDAIGNTPLAQIEGAWVKLEHLNPSGSIKARIAKYMIDQAEAAGELHPGDTIVEASSGNTGNALSMIAAVKGYRMLVVMPHGMSSERLAISRAFGADVLTLGEFHVTEALAKVQELDEQPGYFSPRQFASELNIEENRLWLGEEILAQLPDGVAPDALVVGVGTGGTLIGIGQALRRVNPEVKLFGVEPGESCTIVCGETGRHRIEGIADGFVPEIIQRHYADIDELLSVSSEEALSCMRRLAKTYGTFVGPSSGAHMVATHRIRQCYPELENVVTLFCDAGEKYLSEHFRV